MRLLHTSRFAAAAVSIAGLAVLTTTPAPAVAVPHKIPPPLLGPLMAYDAADNQAVLFGGEFRFGRHTWTWDGRSWLRRFPAHAPPGRGGSAMTYDAADGRIVIFGGYDADGYLADTWTWDGTDWHQEHPVHSPEARAGFSMAYDAADGQVVLFGGNGGSDWLDDTWTWDGFDWSRQYPVRAPSPRAGMGLADDAAAGRVVLFGGYNYGGFLGDTWTWNGHAWSQAVPAHAPMARQDMGLAYDAANGQVVLFGGQGGFTLGGTWTWDGTDWTRRTPRHSPSEPRFPAMADGRVLLFGGAFSGDTWTWNGSDWSMPVPATINRSPPSGPAKQLVTVSGKRFGAIELVTITFVDSVCGKTRLAVVKTGYAGRFAQQVTIPANATPGLQHLLVKGPLSGQVRRVAFTVTGGENVARSRAGLPGDAGVDAPQPAAYSRVCY